MFLNFEKKTGGRGQKCAHTHERVKKGVVQPSALLGQPQQL